MSDLIRTQILLEKSQREKLDKLANERGISLSELVRVFLDSQLRQKTYEDMRQAAERLYDDYTHDEELTSMTALDGEGFY